MHRRGKEARLFLLLAFSIVTIFGIDVISTMDVRGIYYFMVYPLFACACVFLFTKGNRYVKMGAIALLYSIVVLSFCLKVYPAMQKVKDREQDIHYQISADLLSRGITTVYSHWNGCENVAVASRGMIRAGFWDDVTDTYIQVPYLCNPDVYDEDVEKAAYLFYSQNEADLAVKKAAEEGVDIVLLKKYPETQIFVYSAPVRLMMLFREE